MTRNGTRPGYDVTKPLKDTDPMPFGKKHKGKPMSEVPAGYLLWAGDLTGLQPELREYIERNRKVLEDERRGRV